MILLSMTDWWQSLGGMEQVFWAIALIGSALFLIQLTLTFIGLDADLEADFDGGGDGLGLISLRSMIAFATFFGWGGVGALSAGFTPAKAVMIGFLMGFIAMVGLAYALAQLFKMQESGTIDVFNAISKEGEVYIPIPGHKNGVGKVHINVEDKLMEFDAITDEAAISTGAMVRVKDVLEDNIMLVSAL